MSVEPLQTALAAEHAAVYLLALLGGRTSRSTAPGLYADLRSAYETHRARRDQLQSMVADAGDEPVAAAPAYATPTGIDRVRGVRRAARQVERSCATTYAWLVAETEGSTRAWAVNALTDAAVRSLSFGAAPAVLPGVEE